ncbi:hypothetical protein D9757_006299 [Collybiopsis confluens]|uniref:Transcription regulator Rua1 C-terminal domain-containing protein n=1 Tax=Collybiopsis confluens TaxID=2823264 RepID=A0A8H5HGL2_9AGAR|nr:hypothetical protein D9757_006299 [Collybiopsis confluens]
MYQFNFPFNFAADASDSSPSAPSHLYGHVYEFDLSLPYAPFGSTNSFFAQSNPTPSSPERQRRVFENQNTPLFSDAAFTAMGRTKSAQMEDTLPQMPAAQLSVSDGRVLAMSQPTAALPRDDFPFGSEPVLRRAVSLNRKTQIKSHFQSSPSLAAVNAVSAFSSISSSAYNPTRSDFLTPFKNSSSSHRMSSSLSPPSLDPSLRSPSSSLSGPASPISSNISTFYNLQFSAMADDSCDIISTRNMSEVSPVIHQPSPQIIPSASFRLRPADFSRVTTYTQDDDGVRPPKQENLLAEAVCQHVDSLFSPFVLRTPEKSPTAGDAVESSPLTPVTDDESIADSSSMKDDGLQNPLSSLAIHTARKRPYSDLANSPSPAFPPKRARSNLLLALKEQEKLVKKEQSNNSSSSDASGPSTGGPSRLPNTRQKSRASSLSIEPFPVFNQRTFPREVVVDGTSTQLEISDTIFPLFYRRFPASSYFRWQHTPEIATFNKPHPGGNYNYPRGAFDLYTPRFVKGKGKDKMGLCPICIEDVERGGEGRKVWLAMKFSAYKCYHLQYSHGISASSSLPFSPPLAFRTAHRSSNHKSEKSTIKEGKCHKCMKWIPVEGIKDVEVKVKELFWWKHAATCHSNTIIEGEADIFELDEVYTKLKSFGPDVEMVPKKR